VWKRWQRCPLLKSRTSLAIVRTFFVHCAAADRGVQGGGRGSDGVFDNNDFVAFIDAFFSHTGCP
jgi:hypothetical protein